MFFGYFSVATALRSIMRFILFTMIVMVTISLSMHLFAIELIGVFSLGGLFALLGSFVVLVFMFIYCYVSECITTDLMEIGDAFYNTPWYRLPVKQQKLMVLPILRAQREFRLSGLGLIDCSLATFVSVIAFLSFLVDD